MTQEESISTWRCQASLIKDISRSAYYKAERVLKSIWRGAGEAYDKVARLLGLELNPSGGATVEALAREGDAQRFKFSRPLIRKPNCNFSYAGLKTAVRLAIEAEVPGPPSDANRQVSQLPMHSC